MADDSIRDTHRSNNRYRRENAGDHAGRIRGVGPATDEARAIAVEKPRLRVERDLASGTLRHQNDLERAVATRFAQVCGDQAGLAAQSWWYRASKRVFDVAFSLFALMILSPVILLIALLVRIDSPGPALFVQQRIGHRGRVFGMWKFRTMVDGDAGLLEEQPYKRSGHPRLTRVGRVLRITSIDELPQLINVLRGEMSLVGPRPEIVEIALAHYEPWQYRRLLVPQGMTGWWQVTGRGAKLMRKHTEDDLFYIERASFWFDLKILFMTVGAVVRREGAF